MTTSRARPSRRRARWSSTPAPGPGHTLPLERPDAVAEVVRRLASSRVVGGRARLTTSVDHTLAEGSG